MEQSKIKWRDWDWGIGDDLLEPFALERPGQIIFAPKVGFEGYAPSAENWLNQFHAMALLCGQHHFALWTHNISAAHVYYASDPAPCIQAAAADILYAASCGGRYLPRKRFGLDTERMSSAEALAEGEKAAEGALCAGIGIPQGGALLSNVWLGWRPESRSVASVAPAALARFVRIPVAMRWLIVPPTRPYDFAQAVWGEEFVPVAVPKDDAGWKAFESGESYDIIETRPMPVRQIHWVTVGAGNDATAEYAAAQCEATGTPIWIEGASGHTKHDLALQMWPAEADREPLLTPDRARRMAEKGRRDGKGRW